MRFKKQKRHRKIVRFYKACFGFREPFKVLCDGTFVHHLLVNRITPACTALSNVLGANVKVFTTRCVLAELKSLGESYSESFEVARDLMIARCDHEKRHSAVSCIMEVVGDKNSEHFFVATQDADLRKNFQQVPGVPVVFGLRNALLLETPSASQRQFVKFTEEDRSHMSELEFKMLKKIEKGSDLDEHEEPQNIETEMLSNVKGGKGIEAKDKAQFKRKKPKGPNPLSCKKRKINEAPQSGPPRVNDDNKNMARSRSNKRKRSHKNKEPANANT
ncbi:rRNA-processing protein UTP23 homolog [Impatiens glandulifera]|uniref:rRNA-processing protein UTP23 homolog n=1 Tax=Impatiens glandulifera TaxID=253017 RepID=UPI001FB04CDB|nr:rRNA-processing protein UTP23 homolog [Impatiens glandulifera]